MTTPTPNPTHTQALDTLITLGTSLAKILHDAAAHHAETLRAAHPAPTPDTLEHLATAFDRVARATRRAIALANHLANPPPPRPTREPKAAQDPETHRTQSRERVIRDVEAAIERHADVHPDHAETPDSLYAELAERLDDPAFDQAIATTPIDRIIQDLCDDLGITMPHAPQITIRRTPADIRALRDQARSHPTGRTPNPPTRPQPH